MKTVLDYNLIRRLAFNVIRLFLIVILVLEATYFRFFLSNRFMIQARHSGREKRGGALAVVSASYLRRFRSSTMPLIQMLVRLGYDVILVWNGRLPPDCLSLALEHSVEIVERRAVGCDWPGYCIGFVEALNDTRYQTAPCAFFNDSFFYYPKCEGTLKKIRDTRYDICCLAINRLGQPHIVSSCFQISAKARSLQPVINFFLHLPLRVRKRDVITKCEVKFSAVLQESDLSIEVLLDSLLKTPLKHLSAKRRFSRRAKGPLTSDHKYREILVNLGGKDPRLITLETWGPYLSAYFGFPLKYKLTSCQGGYWTALEIQKILLKKPTCLQQGDVETYDQLIKFRTDPLSMVPWRNRIHSELCSPWG